MKIDQGILNRTTQRCIKELEIVPEVLTSFVNDIQKGTHKKWNMWQLHLGQILAERFKGRPVPQRIPRPRGDIQMKIGACYVAEKTGVPFTPQLQLHKCRNDKERAKMILDSGCTPQIKVDLLGALRL